MSKLFESYQLGPIVLKNRIVMAPLTRSRATRDEVPSPMAPEYYQQRASAGLIVSEATQVSQQGQGYLWTPGIFTPAQIEGWKPVVEAVHKAGSHIFLQLWHVGRISHTSLQPNGAAPISSTDEAAENSYSFALDEHGKPGNVPVSKPRNATVEELKQVVADYGQAARNLQQAGFDGAEVHGANGYLFDQFLNAAVNQRTDEYGNGSPASRTKLLLDAFDAVAAVLGPERTGVRIAPFGSFGGMKKDPHTEETFLHLATELSRRRAAYVHIVLGSQNDREPVVPKEFLQKFRKAFTGTIIATGGLKQKSAEALLDSGVADLTGFGTLYISNPDLVERFRKGWPVVQPDPATMYGGGPKGYIDYPTYEQEQPGAEGLDIH